MAPSRRSVLAGALVALTSSALASTVHARSAAKPRQVTRVIPTLSPPLRLLIRCRDSEDPLMLVASFTLIEPTATVGYSVPITTADAQQLSTDLLLAALAWAGERGQPDILPEEVLVLGGPSGFTSLVGRVVRS